MGQYYMLTLIANDGTVSTPYSHQYDNGLKLISFSSFISKSRLTEPNGFKDTSQNSAQIHLSLCKLPSLVG